MWNLWWKHNRESKLQKMRPSLVKNAAKQTNSSVFSAGLRSRNQMTLFDFLRQSCVPLFRHFLRGNSWLLSVKIHKWLMWGGIWKAQSQPLMFRKQFTSYGSYKNVSSWYQQTPELQDLFLCQKPGVKWHKINVPYICLFLMWSIKGKSYDHTINLYWPIQVNVSF